MEITERFSDGSIGVINIVVELTELLSVQGCTLYTDLKQPARDDLDAVTKFVFRLAISGVIDLGGTCRRFGKQLAKKSFCLGFDVRKITYRIVRLDDVETFIHDVCFLAQLIDERDVIIHQDIEKHIVL